MNEISTVPSYKQRIVNTGKKLCPTFLRERALAVTGRRIYHPNFDRLKCIYIHVPKTAGTSIGATLFNSGTPGHWRAEMYKWANPEKYTKYYKFTFVRHPLDRLVSAYFYLMQGGKNSRDLQWAEEHIKEYSDLNDLVERWMTPTTIHKGIHFTPQVDFLKVNNEINMDFIGKYETLEEDFLKISKALGSTKPLPRTNSSIRPPHQNLLTPDNLEKVYSLYKEDFEEFNYSIS